MIAITPIPAFNDNYLWLLDNGQEAIVIDPGDANVVKQYLKTHQLELCAILLTHHHADHTGGVRELRQLSGCKVYGPTKEPISGLDISLGQDDEFTVDSLSLSFKVIEVPGHTRGHIAYFCAQGKFNDNLLFCGDTVFSGGCGRLFEGTAAQMWSSMQKLMTLPDDTLLFPAHEYTLSNLAFATAVEPKNEELEQYKAHVERLRAENKPSLPSRLQLEKQINPFMRIKQADVLKVAQNRLNREDLAEHEVFAAIRHWKDIF